MNYHLYNEYSITKHCSGPIGAMPSGVPKDFRSSERTNGSFNYTTVGISFVIFGSLMLIPIFAGGSEVLGLDWHHLLGKAIHIYIKIHIILSVCIYKFFTHFTWSRF